MMPNKVIYTIAHEWWSTCMGPGQCHQQCAIRAHEKYILTNHLNPEKRRHHWVTDPSNPQIPGCYHFPLAEPPLPFPCWCTLSSLPFTSPLAVLHLCQNSMGCFRVVETAAWQWNWYPSPSSSQAMCRHSGTYQCDWWVGWTAGGTPILIKSKHPQQIGQWWTNKSTTPNTLWQNNKKIQELQ